MAADRVSRLLLRVLLAFLLCEIATAIDQTMTENARGTAVVHAVITKLESCERYNLTDHRLLRRIAYVETMDKQTPPGGLWALSRNNFNLIKTMMKQWLTSSCRGLLDDQVIEHVVNRDPYASTKIPIVSGLAASLYLQHLTTAEGLAIPLADEIEGQATFWRNHYNHSGNKAVFEERVAALEEKESCRVSADIMFVLDISHSIEDEDLKDVIDFETTFVQHLHIGPDSDRIGTVLFGRRAHEVFNFSSHQTTDEVLAAVAGIYNLTQEIKAHEKYPSTNIAAGLCSVWTSFSRDARPSATVFRIAILMSDGRATDTRKNVECGPWNTSEAAEKIRGLQPPVLMYVIGVSNDVDTQQLMSIATDSSHYIYLDDFNQRLFHIADEIIRNDICWKATINITGDKFIDGSLDKDQLIRYNLSVPFIGVTIQVCVRGGQVRVYGSASYPAPNSALNDFQLELECTQSTSGADDCTCKNTFVPGPSQRESLHRQHYDGKVRRQAVATAGLFITVEGRGSGNNEFVVSITDGDSPTDCVGLEVADNCEDNTTTSTPPQNTASGKTIIIATLTSAGALSLLLTCIVILSIIGGWAIRRHRKQNLQREDDEYQLLEDDSGSDGI